MTVRSVYKQNEPNTQYGEFAPHREQKVGLNSASAYDTNSGYSPMTRWMAYAFDYDDFVSNTEQGDYIIRCPVPRYTIVSRVMLRVDTLFDNCTAASIGTGGNGTAAAGYSWMTATTLASTGLKYDPDAVNQPGGTTGAAIYVNGETIDLYTNDGTAPTAGEAIMFIEVISYHEVYSAEW